MKIPFRMLKWLVKFTPKLHKAKCGHRTRYYDLIHEDAFLKLIPKTKKSQVEYCHECLSKMSVPCARCGQDIHVGDFVTLYNYSNKSIKEIQRLIDKGCILYDEKDLRFVGCFRRSCSISGADNQGILYPNHHIHRIPSPIEIAINSQEPVFINNK